LGILLGNADGTFRPALNYSTSLDSAGTIAAGDLNHDGAPDLLLGGRNILGFEVLLGDAKGGFQSKGMYPTTATTNAIDVADFNLDGKLDVVISPGIGKGSGAAMFLGVGDGTLTPAADIGTGTNFSTVAAADFNSDGRPDLVLADPVQVLLGNGDGTFRTSATYPDMHSQNAASLVRDLDGDRKPDLGDRQQCAARSG
jgi:hypothetical protein